MQRNPTESAVMKLICSSDQMTEEKANGPKYLRFPKTFYKILSKESRRREVNQKLRTNTTNLLTNTDGQFTIIDLVILPFQSIIHQKWFTKY